MRLQQTEQTATNEAAVPTGSRYDTKALTEVINLAGRLQQEKQEQLSVAEVEAIGAEVGVEPAFVREALTKLTQRRTGAKTTFKPRTQTRQRTKQNQAARNRFRQSVATAWWSVGWILPVITLIALEEIARVPDGISVITFLFQLAVYITGGILLSSGGGDTQTEHGENKRDVSREALLEQLFDLQRRLEGDKQFCAFLSVDVVGSSAMKQNAPELDAEYSFGRLQRWIDVIVADEGGQVQSAAGDGVMAVFPQAENAVRAARRLQNELFRFNTESNRLPTPFVLRCGVSAGEVALSPGTPLGRLSSPVIDQAAALQKRAAPGDIVVGASVAPTALTELGALSALPERVGGETVFFWRNPNAQ